MRLVRGAFLGPGSHPAPLPQFSKRSYSRGPLPRTQPQQRGRPGSLGPCSAPRGSRAGGAAQVAQLLLRSAPGARGGAGLRTPEGERRSPPAPARTCPGTHLLPLLPSPQGGRSAPTRRPHTPLPGRMRRMREAARGAAGAVGREARPSRRGEGAGIVLLSTGTGCRDMHRMTQSVIWPHQSITESQNQLDQKSPLTEHDRVN